MNISVIIASYNRANSLQQTLDALAAQQYDSNFEVIVVNDGSKDHTLEMLASYSRPGFHLRHFTQANGGPAAARNLGIEKASYPVIAFTDDDCLPEPTWLQAIAEGFQDPEVIALQGSTYTDRAAVTPLTHQIDNETGNPSVPTCNAAYRTDILEKLHGFDVAFPHPHNEDADLAWRAESLGKIAFRRSMRVYHPPRQDTFVKVASRMKIMKSEFRLYYKNKTQYQKYRGVNPWTVIYYEILVKTLGYYLAKRLSNIRKPYEMVTGVALIFIWAFDLIWRYPAFRKEDLLSRSGLGTV